jgi:WD40 repeat protein/tRNA A-37 threonylcarbamoyl transferase component Bud32
MKNDATERIQKFQELFCSGGRMIQHNIPQQLGNYKLLRLIGQGGFATVYLGKHIHLKNYAAIKVLFSRLGSEEEVRRFRHEAETIAQLIHPHIVRVHDFDVWDELAFIVMEYAPFGSLRQQYPPGILVPLPAVVSYVRQVASALQYAHDQRVIHRDIKPENMLISRDSRILLSDFGVALLAQSTRTQSTQSVQDLAGTVAYMAPEQIEGKPRRESDQYALAVTVYEWLCGERPFKGTIAEITAKHLSAPPPPLRAHVPSISLDLEGVVLQALAKDPKERWASVQEFAEALEAAAGVQPRPPSQEQFTTVPLRQSAPDTAMLTRSTVMLTRPLERSNRELADRSTVMPGRVAAQASRAEQHPVLSRRNLLLGLAALVGVGGAGLAVATQHFPLSSHHAVLPPSPRARIAPTAKPSPSPSPAPTPKPTQAPPPTAAAQAPTPTPTPVPGGTLFVTYRGHTNAVFSAAWSPDGTRIASGGADMTARVWQASTGGTLVTYTGHSANVTYVAWSPGSSRVASSSDDKTTQVWDAATGNPFFTCVGHSGSVHSAVFSPDGTRIASGSSDRTVKVWDAATGNLLLTYSGHAASVWAVAWSPDGTRIASASGNPGSADNTVKVWDVATGATLLTCTGHTQRVIYVAWSPGGRHLASGSDDTTVRLWDAATGAVQLISYGHSATVYGVAWSPDSRRVASGSVDTTVQIWDVTTNTIPLTYRGHTSFVFGVTWSPDGMRIASASNDRTVQVWQASRSQIVMSRS